MEFLITVLLIFAAFVAGVLFGRANPNKAKIIKEYADKIKAEASKVTKG